MMCEKCGGGGKAICPVTLGIALGLTCALSVIVCFAWSHWFGLPADMQNQMYMHVPQNWSEAGMRAVWALIKGFMGGFLFALIYDLICCMKSKCCGGQCMCCGGGKCTKSASKKK